MTTNKNTKGNTMTNLGTANGWTNGTPAEYQKHLAECGTEKTVDNIQFGKVVQKTYKTYPVVTRHITNTYHEATCKSCGCTWRRDSSD